MLTRVRAAASNLGVGLRAIGRTRRTELAPIEVDMRGKVCAVTGANSGIGKETALALARMGATVVLVCRNEGRGTAAQEDIKAQTGNDVVSLIVADFSSQQQVREAAAAIQEKCDRLGVAGNNAGVTPWERRETAENGLELVFAVNHLAPFLLTNLLLDRLKATAPARVVTVSSGAHRRVSLNFDDLQNEQRYVPFDVYSQSKLANVYFTYELARRLEGTGVTANCLHPGVVSTALFRHLPPLLGFAVKLARPLLLTPAQGADTAIYLAASPDVADVSGRYFERREAVESSPISHDVESARRLWEVSEALTVHTDGGKA
ncbi:MAG: SDR family oxidoreductase [Chloroflexi bacterium]|nr:SDR family oxidoreductase [Chloroflexota bacterium]